MHKAFSSRPLAACAGKRSLFSAREWESLTARASVEGPLAARVLMKELVVDWLASQGIEAHASQVELLPSPVEGGGPPQLHLPPECQPARQGLHLSLSHSSAHAAALLVVEDMPLPNLDDERTA
jgi:hypothetical protein